MTLRTSLSLGLVLLGAAHSVAQKTGSSARPANPPPVVSDVWSSDQGDGTYRNPVLNADYSDPDAIRVGDRFYLVASSFNAVPGLPILESYDLVNWRILGHALDRQPPFERFASVQHGGGVWAPSIRFHAGEFYIFYPDPDLGIYMIKAAAAEGPWSAPLLIKAAKGWIDPCPLWDDDGKAYLVTGLAASRAGAKSALILSRMLPDGSGLLDGGTLVYDGHPQDETVEGPKMYKRQGYYYIFAPAGGVSTGWQVVLRSRTIYGPYERRVVLHQGSTSVNGPHQGAWVDTGTGEDWFLHFQDRGWLGRVVHLEPMRWVDGWPQMGTAAGTSASDAIGEPVPAYRKPHTLKTEAAATPADSDEFNAPELGPQWQWQANPEPTWGFPSQALGALRLISVPQPTGVNTLWDTPAVLLQKAPGPQFTATTKVKVGALRPGDRAGLVVMGMSYGALEVARTEKGLAVVETLGIVARGNATETAAAEEPLTGAEVYLAAKVVVGQVSFAYSLDGQDFHAIGKPFKTAPGLWIGAKVGLFATGQAQHGEFGYADFDWIRLQKAP